ncbi:MAG: hypothetical protein WAQ08_15930 [Aquabacterium sp.]|uniref:hypothetical protein n=1 Tax=Aquabacterium sp. TaxID=1872578 RepID=UPI003BAFE716
MTLQEYGWALLAAVALGVAADLVLRVLSTWRVQRAKRNEDAARNQSHAGVLERRNRGQASKGEKGGNA